MVTSLSMLEEFTCNNNDAASRDIKSFLPLKVKGTLSRREIADYDEIHGDFMQLAVFPELCNVKLEDVRNVFRDVFKINCERYFSKLQTLLLPGVINHMSHCSAIEMCYTLLQKRPIPVASVTRNLLS
jgi:hypothetical protein